MSRTKSTSGLVLALALSGPIGTAYAQDDAQIKKGRKSTRLRRFGLSRDCR